MQIFKSIDFRTMGLSKWITFILIHTLYNTCLLASDLCCEQTSECYSIDEVERAHNSKEILTAMRVMVVSIGSRGSHIPAMTPRRLRRGVIAGM